MLLEFRNSTVDAQKKLIFLESARKAELFQDIKRFNEMSYLGRLNAVAKVTELEKQIEYDDLWVNYTNMAIETFYQYLELKLQAEGWMVLYK